MPTPRIGVKVRVSVGLCFFCFFLVIVEKVINIDQNLRSQTAMESVWPVSKLSTESVGSRRELVANCVHTDADATIQFRRRRCVLGIMYKHLFATQLVCPWK